MSAKATIVGLLMEIVTWFCRGLGATLGYLTASCLWHRLFG